MRILNIILFFVIFSSCMQQNEPPQAITVKMTEPVSNVIKNGEPFLLFFIKKNHSVWYKYDTILNINNTGLKEIKPVTSISIKEIIDQVEKQNNIKFSVTENILIKGNQNLKYPTFKIIKDAFKQKGIYKFRIITNTDN